MARLTLFQYRFTAAVVITLITLATIFAVRGTFSTFSDTLDLSLRDMLYRQSVHPTPVHPEITVVTIDNASLQSEASGGLGRWQDMRRTAMARVIDHLHRDGAAVIGIDALYSEPSVHPVDDAILGHAVSAAQSVVLGSSVRDSSGILLPISTIGTGAIGIGYFDQTPHPVNSTIYGIEPFLSVSGGFQQAFALTVLQKYYDTLYGQVSPFSQTVHENGTFDFYATEQERITPPITPVAGIRQMLIDWNTPKDYRTISYADVYYDRYDHAFIKDHIVLIGATATTLDDLKRTPIGIIPGIYVHANIINTIMEHAYIVPLSVMREGIVLILSLLMLSLIGVYVRRWYLLLTVVACSFGGFFVGYV